MLAVGTQIEPFMLPDDTGTLVSSDALLAEGPLILFFYPGDFTPVCTREACLVRDTYAELRAAGLGVAGISPDAPDKHARFRARYALDYPLLADTERVVIRQFDVAGPMGFGVRRASFLIAADGTIVDAVLADLRLARHGKFMRRAIALRAGAPQP